MTTLFPQVAVDLKFCQETVSLALHYLMRFGVEMSFQELSCQKFQLAAITSMFVASKIEEPRPLSIVSLSNTFFFFFTHIGLILSDKDDRAFQFFFFCGGFPVHGKAPSGKVGWVDDSTNTIPLFAGNL